jgi:hypothetical protein
MSFPLTSPIDIVGLSNDSILNFSDSTLTSWNLKKTNTDKFSIGSNTITDALSIDDTTGDSTFINNVTAVRMKLLANGFKTTLQGSTTLTGDYTVEFPDVDGATNQVLMQGASMKLEWRDLFVNPQNTLIVTKNPNPSEFISVNDAIASIPISGPNVPSAINRYVIHIYPGVYQENPIILPSYVSLVGEEMVSCILEPIGSGDFLNFSNNSNAAFLSIINVPSPDNAMTFIDVGDNCICHKIEISNSPRGILCSCIAIESEIYLEYVDLIDSTEYCLNCISTGAEIMIVSVENFFTFNHSDNAIIVDGAQIQFLAQACALLGDGVGNCIVVQNDADIVTKGVYFDLWDNAVYTPTTGNPVNLLMAGCLFQDCVLNFNIANPLATGSYDGTTEYAKTMINISAPFYIQGTDLRIITVSKKGGDFTSVADAMNSISGTSSVNQYVIQVGPGLFTESNFTFKSYVSVIGVSRNASIIRTVGTGTTFITGASNSTINNLTLMGSNTAGNIIYTYNGGAVNTAIRFQSVTFINSETYVSIGSSVGQASILFEDTLFSNTGTFKYGFQINDTIGNRINFLVHTFIWNPTNFGNFNTLFQCISNDPTPNNLNVFLSDIFVGQNTIATAGTALSMTGSLGLNLLDTIMRGFNTAIYVSNSVLTAPNMNIASIILDNNVLNIDVQNASTTGIIDLIADSTLIYIAPGTDIGLNIQNPDGTLEISGQLRQGKTINKITDISTQIQQGSAIGKIDGGDISINAGLNITVSSGDGYLMVGTAPNDDLQYTIWATDTFNVTASQLTWIYVDNSAVIMTSTSKPDIITNIILGTVKSGVSTIEYITANQRVVQHNGSYTDRMLRDAIGPIFVSGCLASPGSSGMKVDVSSGQYYFGLLEPFNPISVADITMLAYYSGSIDATSITDVPLQWDNAGTLTAITVGSWVKHALYIVNDNVDEPQKYLFVYGEQEFLTELDAQVGGIPNKPSYFVGNISAITAIIVTDSDTVLIQDRFRDIRPTLSFTSQGSTASADHNSLLNLTVGNAHPQYLRRDGTDGGMSASLNMNSNNITTAGTVNGVTVEAHASRHLPGGADPLTTAAPITISTSNSIGIANSFSRSDHLHSHGAQTDPTLHAISTTIANGFMSSTDKTKLDNSTSSATINTLALRDGNGELDVRRLGVFNNTSGFKLIFVSPAVAADYIYTLPLTDGTSGYVLSTNGSGTMSWVNTSGFSDPTTTIGDIIYRNPVNAVARLPIGSQGQYLRSLDSNLTYQDDVIPIRETRFFDDFNGGASPFGDSNWLLSTISGGATITSVNSNIAAATVTSGEVSLNTGNNNAGSVTISKNLLALRFSQGPFTYECAVLVPTLPSVAQNFLLRIGFGNAVNAAVPTNGIWFEHTSNPSTVWTLKAANGATTTTVTATTVLTNQWMVLGLTVNTSGTSVSYFVNGVNIGTITTNIPISNTTKCGPILTITKTAGTTTRALIVDYVKYNYQITSPGRY